MKEDAMLLIILLTTIFGAVLGATVVLYFLVYLEDNKLIHIRKVRCDKGSKRGPRTTPAKIWPELD